MADEHRCQWRDSFELLERKFLEREEMFAKLVARVTELEQKAAVAERKAVGPKSERMPTPDEAARKKSGETPGRAHLDVPSRRKSSDRLVRRPPMTWH